MPSIFRIYFIIHKIFNTYDFNQVILFNGYEYNKYINYFIDKETSFYHKHLIKVNLSKDTSNIKKYYKKLRNILKVKAYYNNIKHIFLQWVTFNVFSIKKHVEQKNVILLHKTLYLKNLYSQLQNEDSTSILRLAQELNPAMIESSFSNKNVISFPFVPSFYYMKKQRDAYRNSKKLIQEMFSKRNSFFNNSINNKDIEIFLANKFKEIILEQLKNIVFYIYQADYVCKYFKPKILIQHMDVKPYELAFTNIANKYNIPSVNIQHGLNPEFRGVDKMFSKHYLIWGQDSKQRFIRNGNVETNFYITGAIDTNIMIEHFNNESENNLFKIKGIKKGTFTVTILARNSQHTTSSYKYQDSELFFLINAIKSLKNIFKDEIQILIKLHPGDKNTYFYKSKCENILKNIENIFFFQKGMYYETIEAADLVLSPGSSSIIDAIILNKPTILLTLFKRDDIMGYSNYKVLKYANTLEEFEIILSRFKLDKEEFLMNFGSQREIFIKDYIYKLDSNSLARMMKVINTLMKVGK